MPILYTIAQNIDREINVYDEDMFASPNIEIISRQYSEYAHEWIHNSLQHPKEDETKHKGAPILLRLSDMTVLCSVADVIQTARDLHNEYIAKSKQIDAELTQFKTDYDEQINAIATKMMSKNLNTIDECSPSNALYCIVQDTGNDEFKICGNVIDNGLKSLSLEYHKESYVRLALKWFQIAVKDYGEKWTQKPPVLIRLSDSAIMYSMLDYMPEVKALYDEFETKMKRVEEESKRLTSEYDEKIRDLVRVQVGLVPGVAPPHDARP